MVIWIPCSVMQPTQDGQYIVTTCNGQLRFDRFIGGEWGLCRPRAKTRSAYRPHKAWAYLPKPYEEKKCN